AFFCQRQKVPTLDHHASSHGLLASCDPTLFILLACIPKLPVPLRNIRRCRHRHPVVAPKVARFPFDTALLLWLGRRAKLRLIPPVRPKGHEARRLFPPRSAQNPLYCRGEVVIAELTEYTAKIRECQFVRFQE